MIVSNEPGYYENGNYGIRIENLLEVVERPEFGTFGGNGFLGFRKLTMIPIQKKMLVLDLLTGDEVRPKFFVREILIPTPGLIEATSK